MKNIIFTILILILNIETGNTCCGEMNPNLIEVLHDQGVNRSAFLVVIDSTIITPEYSYKSYGTLIKGYKGSFEDDKVEIFTGGNTTAGGTALKENKYYFVLSREFKKGKFSGFVCDAHSRLLSSNKDSFEIVSLMDKVKYHIDNSYTGEVKYTFKNIILGEGKLKKGLPHGVWSYYYRDGKIKSEIVYQDGQKVKLEKKYNEEGILYMTINSINSTKKNTKNFRENGSLSRLHFTKKDKQGFFYGKSIQYNENGDLQRKYFNLSGVTYMRSTFVRKYIEYSEEGSLIAKGRYFRGAKVGRWLEWNSNDSIVESTIYPRIKKHRKAYYWYHENGKLAVKGQLNAQGKNGEWIEFNERGDTLSFGAYRNDEKVGYWRYFYGKNGNLESEGNYVDGKKDAYWVSYRFKNDGINYEGNYRLGKQIGAWNSYYSNNLIERTINYNEDGKSHGDYIMYYKDGSLRRTWVSDKGIMNGWYIDYFENGQIKEKGLYENGFKNGDWLQYNQEGKVIRKCTHSKPKSIWGFEDCEYY